MDLWLTTHWSGKVTAVRLTGERVSEVADVEQRRAAFRVDVKLPVWVEYPVERDCELVDISVLGARFNTELPCAAGSTSEFLLVTEEYGTIPVAGEVVRVNAGETAVRFMPLAHNAERAVTEIITAEQRRRLQHRLGVA